jgi:diaminopimelate epimerase
MEVSENNISLSMNDVKEIKIFPDGFFLNTGSPHFVKFVDNISILDIFAQGKAIADEARFSPNRTNVNFVEISGDQIKIATFERGVEDETLACGTGAVAAAIALHYASKIKTSPIILNAKGGDLKVSFTKIENIYSDIKLIGPAKFVFSGETEL